MIISNALYFRILTLSVGIVGLVLTVAACGGGGGSSSSGTTSGTTVTVSEKEWVITVGGTDLQNGNGDASVPTGKVTFDIKNDGTIAHEFEIKGNGIDQKSNSIDPGKTEKLTVDLTAGQYEVWCPVPGHKEAGMDGHVTAS